MYGLATKGQIIKFIHIRLLIKIITTAQKLAGRWFAYLIDRYCLDEEE